tara:strand:- start:201 stop:317 length:117 start_codon:yes stop_codon:yes gene_type:complete
MIVAIDLNDCTLKLDYVRRDFEMIIVVVVKFELSTKSE